MSAAEVLREADRRGVELWATPEGKLRWRAEGKLPADLASRISACKPDLLQLLGYRTEPTPMPRQVWTPQDDDWVCRAIEKSEGLPAGSLTLNPPAEPFEDFQRPQPRRRQ